MEQDFDFKSKSRANKKDAHTGKRSDNKPKTHVDHGIVKEDKNQKRDRIDKVFNRARKISEKLKLYQEIRNDVDEYMFPIEFNDDSSSNQIDVLSGERANTFKNVLGASVENYFLSGNLDSAISELNDLYDPELKRLIIYIAVEKGLNYKAKQCEMVSVYLSKISMNEILVDSDFMKGFSLLFSDIDDLVIDFPNAVNQIGTFLARAIIDECMPPIYLKNQLNFQKHKKIRASVKYASYLSRHSHIYPDINKIWGECSSLFGISELLAHTRIIINRYLEDVVFNDFYTSLRDMEVPHFHYAVVKETLLALINAENEATTSKVVKLFQKISETALMTDEQIEQGLDEIVNDFVDIVTDNPNAKKTLEDFIKKAKPSLPIGFLNKAHKYNIIS